MAGLLAHHWLGAHDEDKAIRYLTVAGDRARQDYALDEAIAYYRELLPLLDGRGERQEIALVLFKLALALHMSLRFAEANETYQRAFEHWTPPAEVAARPDADLRVATSFLPDDPDPRSAIAWPNIQLCMQLFDRLVEQWPERTIVPSLAERWQIADDGLRYVFHLREGLTWSDGEPLTAHDVEFGIKRVLDPPGARLLGRDLLRAGRRPGVLPRHGARSVGDRGAGARRPHGRVPARRTGSLLHERDEPPGRRAAAPARDRGDGRRVDRAREAGRLGRVPGVGARRRSARARAQTGGERRTRGQRPARRVHALADHGGARALRARRSGHDRRPVHAAARGPRRADVPDAKVGQAGWSGYLAFDHESPIGADLELRRALAHAIDRDTLGSAMPANMVVATGGIVPPALQGHTPDISLRFDPDAALACLARSGNDGPGVGRRARRRPPHPRAGARGLAIGARAHGRAAPVVDRRDRDDARAEGTVADLLHGVAAGVRRSRVLPAALVPLPEPHERGRLRPSTVRRADRAGASGTQRPWAPGALPRRRSHGRRRPRRGDPARVRP